MFSFFKKAFQPLMFIFVLTCGLHAAGDDQVAEAFYALDCGYNNDVVTLIKSGIDVNKKNGDGDTLLHCAVEVKSKKVVFALLQAEADPMALDRKGMTALHVAAGSGIRIGLATGSDEKSFVIMKKILEQKGIDINCQMTETDDTPLHLAAEFGQIDKVLLLLEHKAHPCILNKRGQKPSDVALIEDIKEILLKAERKRDTVCYQ